MRSRSLAGLAVVAAGAFALAGCSDQSFADHAEEYLNDVEGENGEDYSEASCEEPESTDVGATFACTSVDANGATISWVAEITGEERYVLREAGSEDVPTDTTGTGTDPTTAATTGATTPVNATTTTAAATATTATP